MFRDEFDPADKNTLVGVEPWTVTLRIIAARHLCRPRRGTASPFVEVEVIGAPFDSGVKLTTKPIGEFLKSSNGNSNALRNLKVVFYY